jgi:hypothetical protein
MVGIGQHAKWPSMGCLRTLKRAKYREVMKLLRCTMIQVFEILHHTEIPRERESERARALLAYYRMVFRSQPHDTPSVPNIPITATT